MYTFFLGTNPRLSASEILSVLKRIHSNYTLIARTSDFIRLDIPNGLPPDFIKNLGGTIRISSDVHTWKKMPSADEICEALAPLPPRWDVGLGTLGMSQNIRALGSSLKKAARIHDSRLSFIEPKGGHASLLNAAQVIFNKLTTPPNAELIFLQHEGQVILMKTLGIQDIASYEIRDTSRPARDARVGLLPPKLAQIMINLALGASSQTGEELQKNPPAIYDPFCGMGTILQEAYLMGIQSFGTDISERMIEATAQNLEHLRKNFSVDENLKPVFTVHDVTNPDIPKTISHPNITVVTEPFLGTPLSRPLSPAESEEFAASVMPLYWEFFVNMKSVLPKNGRILLLLPAPKVVSASKGTFTPLPRTFLDEIVSIGYRKGQLIPTEISSTMAANGTQEPLIYARPDALIARELTLWERD